MKFGDEWQHVDMAPIGGMVVRNMWFCMDLLTGWSSLISMPASIHKSTATSLNAWSILLEYSQHTLQLMQCNESNNIEKTRTFWKPRQFQDFLSDELINSQRFNEILHYNKINTKLYYSDRCIHCFTETFITPADQFLGLQLKKKQSN